MAKLMPGAPPPNLMNPAVCWLEVVVFASVVFGCHFDFPALHQSFAVPHKFVGWLGAGVTLKVPTVISDPQLKQFMDSLASAARQFYVDFLKESTKNIRITVKKTPGENEWAVVWMQNGKRNENKTSYESDRSAAEDSKKAQEQWLLDHPEAAFEDVKPAMEEREPIVSDRKLKFPDAARRLKTVNESSTPRILRPRAVVESETYESPLRLKLAPELRRLKPMNEATGENKLTPKEKKALSDIVQKALPQNKYFESATGPLRDMDPEFAKLGFEVDSEGVYTGKDGSARMDIHRIRDGKWTADIQNAVLVWNWHKMESGRYELTGYIS